MTVSIISLTRSTKTGSMAADRLTDHAQALAAEADLVELVADGLQAALGAQVALDVVAAALQAAGDEAPTIVRGQGPARSIAWSLMRKSLKAAIGRVLRAKRERLAISQEELAEFAGVDRTYVSILERGIKSPTVETLERISVALGTLPERVIEEARAK